MRTLQITLPDFVDMDTGEIMLCNRQKTDPAYCRALFYLLTPSTKKSIFSLAHVFCE